jgi:hypothetical protein
LPSPTEIPLFVGEYAWLISADNDERPLPVDLLDADMVRYHAEEVVHNARAAAVGEQGRTRGHWQKNGHGFGKTFVSSSGMRHFSRRAGYVLASSGAPCAPVAQLARIDQIYCNYSIDVTLLDMETMEFDGERIERVPYAQLRTLRDGRLSREVNKPDLTVAARDAAVAELARHHAAQKRAEEEQPEPPMQCQCSAEYLETLKSGMSRSSTGHSSFHCPIGKFRSRRSLKLNAAFQRRDEERRGLEDRCRELKGIDAGWRFGKNGVTVCSLAEYLSALSCDATVISYIRGYAAACERQRQFRGVLASVSSSVDCKLAHLRKESCPWANHPWIKHQCRV